MNSNIENEGNGISQRHRKGIYDDYRRNSYSPGQSRIHKRY